MVVPFSTSPGSGQGLGGAGTSYSYVFPFSREKRTMGKKKPNGFASVVA